MSNNCHERYILDAYAVLCYLEDESQAEKIALLLKKAVDKQISLFMTWINLGEVYYRVWREYGETKAQEVLADAFAIAAALKYVFSHLPIVIVERKFYL